MIEVDARVNFDRGIERDILVAFHFFADGVRPIKGLLFVDIIDFEAVPWLY